MGLSKNTSLYQTESIIINNLKCMSKLIQSNLSEQGIFPPCCKTAKYCLLFLMVLIILLMHIFPCSFFHSPEAKNWSDQNNIQMTLRGSSIQFLF